MRLKSNQGFTLIELLVVIIIISILSAIALPSFLNQASKARASEAKVNLSSILRTQQAYFLENQSFAEDLNSLKLGIKNTDNYNYDVYTPSKESSGAVANAVGYVLKSHIGAIAVERESTFDSVLCESPKPDNQYSSQDVKTLVNNNLRCKGLGRRLDK